MRKTRSFWMSYFLFSKYVSYLARILTVAMLKDFLQGVALPKHVFSSVWVGSKRFQTHFWHYSIFLLKSEHMSWKFKIVTVIEFNIFSVNNCKNNLIFFYCSWILPKKRSHTTENCFFYRWFQFFVQKLQIILIVLFHHEDLYKKSEDKLSGW